MLKAQKSKVPQNVIYLLDLWKTFVGVDKEFKKDPDEHSNPHLINTFLYYINIVLKSLNYSFRYILHRRKYYMKKYFFTINHKRIGINYFFLSLLTAMSGAFLATALRLELAAPGSMFFKGDSLKYLQVITAHGLIMIFFVVVPVLFGGFANFLLPYHIGSKDVAFPRLNLIGLIIQPGGFLLISRSAFLRSQY